MTLGRNLVSLNSRVFQQNILKADVQVRSNNGKLVINVINQYLDDYFYVDVIKEKSNLIRLFQLGHQWGGCLELVNFR